MATQFDAETRASRGERINFRATVRQEQLLKAAAAATERTMTDFVLDAAVTQAEKVLADRRYFILTDEQWSDLDRLLAAPTRHTPKLAALLSEPSPFGAAEA